MNNRELYHYGVIGMKWGVRRYQNEDGTLTEAGKQRLKKWKEKEEDKVTSRYKRRIDVYERGASRYSKKGKFNKAKEYTKEAKYTKRSLKTELKKIRNYSLDDVNKENKKVGKAIAKNVLATTLGSTGLAVLTGGVTPIVIPVYYKTSQYRTDLRITAEEDNENYRAIFGEDKPAYKIHKGKNSYVSNFIV